MKYKSDAFEAIHEDAMASFKVGAISRERMKEYDEMCLVQESQTEPEIEESVEMEHVTV
jgi:putative transcriptional regulator